MINFDAGAVLKGMSAIRQVQGILDNLAENAKFKRTDKITRANALAVQRHIKELKGVLATLGIRTTGLAVSELDDELRKVRPTISYKRVSERLQEIAVTLRREMSLVKIFCVSPSKEPFFEFDLNMLGTEFKIRFPSGIFEIDESGKCFALGRSTAAVFHLMRSMEIGIRATARCLNIPDPIKGSDKNWGQMLGKIKAEIDKRTHGNTWRNADKEFFISSYATLDAARVAWRNTTMHVENKYTEDEAEHIFVVVKGFMKKLAERMDESGQPAA